MIESITPPLALSEIETWTRTLGFTMSCDGRTGALLRLLAATKPGGRLLELGTGTGAGSCWLLDGMDRNARLITVDNDPTLLHAARSVLGEDPRFEPVEMDGEQFLAGQAPASFDLIFADAWPGKFSRLEQTIELLKPGGIYLVDDLLPQPNWPKDGHEEKVTLLCMALEAHAELRTVTLPFSTGLMLCTRH